MDSEISRVAKLSAWFFCFFWENSGELKSFSVVAQEAATRGVLWKRCSYKFHKILRRTPVPKSLFLIKLQAQACNFIKKETVAEEFSCEFCEISRSTFFTENVWTTASKKWMGTIFWKSSIKQVILKWKMKNNFHEFFLLHDMIYFYIESLLYFQKHTSQP